MVQGRAAEHETLVVHARPSDRGARALRRAGRAGPGDVPRCLPPEDAQRRAHRHGTVGRPRFERTISGVAHIARSRGLERTAGGWQHAFVASFPGTPLDETRFAKRVCDAHRHRADGHRSEARSTRSSRSAGILLPVRRALHHQPDPVHADLWGGQGARASRSLWMVTAPTSCSAATHSTS